MWNGIDELLCKNGNEEAEKAMEYDQDDIKKKHAGRAAREKFFHDSLLCKGYKRKVERSLSFIIMNSPNGFNRTNP